MFRYYTAIIILIVQHFQYNKKQNMTDKIFKIVLKYVRQKCIKTLKFYLKREILWVIFMLFLFISTWKLILTFEIRQYKGNKINLKKKEKVVIYLKSSYSSKLTHAVKTHLWSQLAGIKMTIWQVLSLWDMCFVE